MTRYVLTGQPPTGGGRLAVGPFRNQELAEQARGVLVVELGWSEVWQLPLAEQLDAQLLRRDQ